MKLMVIAIVAIYDYYLGMARSLDKKSTEKG